MRGEHRDGSVRIFTGRFLGPLRVCGTPIPPNLLCAFEKAASGGCEITTGLEAGGDGAAGGWGEDSYASEVCCETVFEDHIGHNRNSQVGGDQILDGFGLLALELNFGLKTGVPAELQGELAGAVELTLIEDEAFSLEFRERDSGLSREGMFAADGEREIFGEEFVGAEALGRGGTEGDGDIDLAVANEGDEDAGAAFLAQADDHVRELFLEDAQDDRQEMGSDGGEDADSHNSEGAALGFEHAGAGFVNVREDAFGVGDEDFAGTGHLNLAADAFEKGDAEVGFETTDLDAEGWLGFAELIGGAAEVACAGDGEEALQLREGH
jgi:hypothetical protein